MAPIPYTFSVYQGSTFGVTLTKYANANLTKRGTWTPYTTYSVDDLVVWNGAIYKCILAHTTGQQPPNITYWDSPTVQDLSSSTFAAKMKRNTSDTNEVASLTIDFVTDGTDGKITLGLTALQTAALSGTYYYDLEITTGANIDKWLSGKFIVSDEVTA